MARPSLKTIAALADVQTTYKWDMSFTKSRYGVSAGTNLRCLSTTLPKRTNEPIELKVRGHTFKQPGQVNESGTIELQFYETTDVHVTEFIERWAEAASSPDEGKGKPNSEVFNELLIRLLDRNDSGVKEYQLLNVFVEDYDLGPLDGENSAMMPTVTLAYSGFSSKKI